MSRNLRHSSRVTPTKTPARKTTTNYETSSDDDYAGVNLISDSEEDEPDVEVAEEQAIIDSAEEDDDEDLQDTPRPTQEYDQISWSGIEEFIDEPAGHFDTSRTASFNATDEELGASPTRKVHFNLSDYSSSDSENSEDVDTMFPDLFMDQSRLDPGFRKMYENDDYGNDSSSNESTYWDIGNSDEIIPQIPLESDGDSDSDSASLSGYDSDGETTEEDLPAAASAIRTRTVLRRISNASSSSTSSSSSDSTSEDIVVSVKRRLPTRRGPKLGQWIHDLSRPFAIIDKDSKKLLLFNAERRRFSFNGITNRAPMNMDQVFDSPQSALSHDMSPMISNSANLMMSAMSTISTPYDNNFHGPALGPPEAFYPFTSVNADGTIIQESHSDFDDDIYSSDGGVWDIEDIINFEDASLADGDENLDEDLSTDSPAAAGDLTSTPVRPTTATSEDQVNHLLNHFNSGVVGAFRKNQNRHQLLSRNAETHASLAFQGPIGNGAIRGIKGGRLQAANVPITPLRKHKSNRRVDGPPADSSPLAHLTGGAIEDKKRKFDMDDRSRGHKRSKSLI